MRLRPSAYQEDHVFTFHTFSLLFVLFILRKVKKFKVLSTWESNPLYSLATFDTFFFVKFKKFKFILCKNVYTPILLTYQTLTLPYLFYFAWCIVLFKSASQILWQVGGLLFLLFLLFLQKSTKNNEKVQKVNTWFSCCMLGPTSQNLVWLSTSFHWGSISSLAIFLAATV